MRNPDPHVVRLLSSLSTLVGKQLELVEGAVENDSPAIVPGSNLPRMAIRNTNDIAFSDPERALLCDVLELVRRDRDSAKEFEALDQRLRLLERENLEFTNKNRALSEASSRDSLTGLYNRWYIIDKIEAEMNRALRHGSPLALLMIDVDHFKKVNDSYGHRTGDLVLQAIGQVLKTSCRVYDIPGRYGGEEFCLMLPDTALEHTTPVAERIRRRVEATPFAAGQAAIRVTASIGIAGLESVPDEGLFSASSLIERADRALYTAKDRGRNRVETWHPALNHRAHAADH